MRYMLDGEETERLQFRLLLKSDFNTWLAFFENSDAAGFIGMKHIASPKDQCQQWFNRIMRRYDNNRGGMNVLIDKNTKQFIGQCGLLLQKVDGVVEMEIGYSIMPQYWNQGYASEAAQKCRNYAFNHNFSKSIISIIHVDNTRSEKVAIKNGMHKTKQTVFNDMPVYIFRIDKTEWSKLIR